MVKLVTGSIWIKTWIKCFGHLMIKIKKYENSKKHKKSVDLALMGKIDVASPLSMAYKDSIKKHNDNVRKNYQILSTIIDFVKFYKEFLCKVMMKSFCLKILLFSFKNF